MPDKIYFLVDRRFIVENNFILSDKESYHFNKVLRKKVDTEIWLTDGHGTVYKSVVQKINKNIVSGQIQEVYPNYGENNLNIHLGIGILKKDKLELVVEKLTECGVTKFMPLKLDRCIKHNINHDRLNKISISALKQCGRSFLPTISVPSKLEEIISDYKDKQIVVCHESGAAIIDVIKNENKNISKMLLLVGPEGDFSQNEIKLLKNCDANFINLGKRRLRSETAAMAAVSQINLIYG